MKYASHIGILIGATLASQALADDNCRSACKDTFNACQDSHGSCGRALGSCMRKCYDPWTRGGSHATDDDTTSATATATATASGAKDCSIACTDTARTCRTQPNANQEACGRELGVCMRQCHDPWFASHSPTVSTLSPKPTTTTSASASAKPTTTTSVSAKPVMSGSDTFTPNGPTNPPIKDDEKTGGAASATSTVTSAAQRDYPVISLIALAVLAML